MVSFTCSTQHPELAAQLKGRITLRDLSTVSSAFEEEVARMRPGFVLLVEYTELEAIDLEAQGVLLYLSRCVLEANPAYMVLVNGAGQVVSQTLRDFMYRLDDKGKLCKFTSRGEAEAFLADLPVAAAR